MSQIQITSDTTILENNILLYEHEKSIDLYYIINNELSQLIVETEYNTITNINGSLLYITVSDKDKKLYTTIDDMIISMLSNSLLIQKLLEQHKLKNVNFVPTIHDNILLVDIKQASFYNKHKIQFTFENAIKLLKINTNVKLILEFNNIQFKIIDDTITIKISLNVLSVLIPSLKKIIYKNYPFKFTIDDEHDDSQVIQDDIKENDIQETSDNNVNEISYEAQSINDNASQKQLIAPETNSETEIKQEHNSTESDTKSDIKSETESESDTESDTESDEDIAFIAKQIQQKVEPDIKKKSNETQKKTQPIKETHPIAKQSARGRKPKK